MTDRLTCPTCNGSGSITGVACPGFRIMDMPCNTCQGRGTVSADYPERLRRGKELRAARLARRESLLDAARWMHMSVVDYSRLERGVLEPDE